MFRLVQIIVNATAGAFLAGRKMKYIKERMKKSGCEPVIALTKYRLHAKELAIEAVNRNADLIISVGGDGTINEIVNGIMESQSFANRLPALGILSAGTGADLCRTLKIPFNFDKAIQVILDGKLTPIDIGMVKFKNRSRTWYRYFTNVFDVGLGGNVVRIANHIPKHLGGFLTFLLSSLAGLLTFKPIPMKIYVDNKLTDKGNITIIGATNGKFFGGGMKIAPMASISDGFFEILYVKDTNIFKFIQNVLLPVYDGKHLLFKNLYHFRARKLKVAAEKTFLADIDGEEEKAQEVEISIAPKQIMVTVPD
ncbi:MAG: diacylglycerol kinase family protein [candidate division WOR-3 bacterium]